MCVGVKLGCAALSESIKWDCRRRRFAVAARSAMILSITPLLRSNEKFVTLHAHARAHLLPSMPESPLFVLNSAKEGLLTTAVYRTMCKKIFC
jgi:hypothetical protein